MSSGLSRFTDASTDLRSRTLVCGRQNQPFLKSLFVHEARTCRTVLQEPVPGLYSQPVLVPYGKTSPVASMSYILPFFILKMCIAGMLKVPW